MSFFRNSQIAKKYKISNTTVANWIKASENGDNSLELTKINNKNLIIDSLHNKDEIERILRKGKRRTSETKKVQAKGGLYKTLDSSQIYEIVNSLCGQGIIPYKFTYLGKGAEYWDKHYQIAANQLDMITGIQNQFSEENISDMCSKFLNYNHVNIFDFGCGNGLPSLQMIKYLTKQGKKVTYTALDISPDMIKIDKANLLKEVPNIDYESHIIDLDKFNISDLIISKKKHQPTASMLLFLGGTLGNIIDEGRLYANLKNSMGQDDYLIADIKLANPDNLTQEKKRPHNEYHVKRTTWILDALGLKGFYSEEIYDHYRPEHSDYIRQVPILYNVESELNINGQKIVLRFNEGDNIIVSRFKRYTESEIITKLVSHDFLIQQLLTNQNHDYTMMNIRPKKAIKNRCSYRINSH